MNRAARLMSAGSGGQILCEEEFMLQVLREWEQQEQKSAEQAGEAGVTESGADVAPTGTPAAAADVEVRVPPRGS